MTDLIAGPEGTATPPKGLWDWSPQARAAFLDAAGIQRVPHLTRALNAALEQDIPAIFRAQVEGMIQTLVRHPVLGDRVLKLRANEDGLVHLRVDEALIRFILFDEVPEGVLDERSESKDERPGESPAPTAPSSGAGTTERGDEG